MEAGQSEWPKGCCMNPGLTVEAGQTELAALTKVRLCGSRSVRVAQGMLHESRSDCGSRSD